MLKLVLKLSTKYFVSKCFLKNRYMSENVVFKKY